MESLRFTGSGSEYFKIWIVNVLLTIITLGLYYPWAKVRNRRYFYSNTILNDRNFEYHATGKQLFIGFLIALVLFIVYTMIGQLHPGLAGIFLLIFLLAMPWLVWRSLMFNMKVTSFSNVHFSFAGTLGNSYTIFIGYPFLVMVLILVTGLLSSILIPTLENLDSSLMGIGMVVLGIGFMLAYLSFIAFLSKSIKEYVINGSRYGQGIFETKLKTKKFVIIMLKTAALSLIPMFGLSFVIGAIMPTMMGSSYTPGSSAIGGAELAFILGYFAMIFIMMLVMSYYVSRERAYVYENTQLDNKIAFASTLKARSFAWIMASNFFLILITLGLYFPWAKVRVARMMLENTKVDTSIGFDAYLTQKQDEVSSLGEQIGDAFDVDVGVAF